MIFNSYEITEGGQKMNIKKIITATFVLANFVAFAKIDIATPFNDGVVLQRDRLVPIWGSAEPGKKITVEFADNKVTTFVSKEGKWKVELPPMVASKENRIMRITEVDDGFFFDDVVDTLEIKDVLVGEVWMCAGQSNTDCPIWGGDPRYRDGDGAMIILSTYKPFVRLVKNQHIASTKPRTGYKAKWVAMTPEMYDLFKNKVRLPSAMGYYFALELANALDIPIGIVDSSWGGTNIDAWTPPSGYENVPELADIASLPRLEKEEFEISQKKGIYKGKRLYNVYVQQPSLLWNGLVAAYAPMACRGLIWYQGCHNSLEPERYCSKMHALYNGWSKEFNNPNFKLYFSQLAPWKENFVGIAQAQNKFVSEQKNAEISVLTDAGNFDDIHPNNKRVIAKRLSLHALKNDYGFSTIKSLSPLFKGVEFKEGKAIMSFENAQSWYVYANNWSLEPAFEIAGKAGVWHAAKLENIDSRGRVKGVTLTVSSTKVPEPVKVRYLYKNRTAGTVYNEGSLPLGPFISK